MGKITNGGRSRMESALSPPFPGTAAPTALTLGLGLCPVVALGEAVGLGVREGVGELTGAATMVKVAQGATAAWTQTRCGPSGSLGAATSMWKVPSGPAAPVLRG